MTTENKLTTLNIFPSEQSYETNKGSLGNSDLALVPLTLDFVPITGDRGELAGYGNSFNSTSALTVNAQTRDGVYHSSGTVTVQNGANNTEWTKTIALGATVTISLGDAWKWINGEVPTVSPNSLLVLHWCHSFGVANLLVTTA